MEKKKILDEISQLIQDIDKCAGDIVKGRANGIEGFADFANAHIEAERLLVLAHQELSFLYDYLKDAPDIEKLPKWKKTIQRCCWSKEIGVDPQHQLFKYENYTINADKLFKLLPKEE